MLLGLGWPEWLLIVGLVGGLLVTFKVMVRAAASYEKARQRREAAQRDESPAPANRAGTVLSSGEERS